MIAIRTSLAGPADSPSSGAARIRVVRGQAAALVSRAEVMVQQLGWAGVVGLALLVFSVGLLLATNLPLRHQVAELQRSIDVTRATASADRSARRAADPSVRLAGFLAGLPRQSDLPQVIERMLRHAKSAGVEFERGNYEMRPGDSKVIARYAISLPVRATYPQIRAMTGAILAELPAVALESLRVERDGVSEEIVAADLRFVVFVRGEP